MIETSRLFIRKFVEEDRNSLVLLLQSDEFMEYSDSGVMSTVEADARFNELVSMRDKSIGKFAVICKESGALIGYCGIEPFELKNKNEFELGYRLVTAERGKGLATEAAKAVLNNFKGKLFAYVDSSNNQSINVLKKLGFKSSGVFTKNGKESSLFQINK